MNNCIDIIVDSEHHGYKVQIYMREVLDFSSRFCRKAAREGKIKINDERVTLFTKLSSGDRLRIFLPDKNKNTIEEDKIDLNILYEDDLIIAIEKKPGIIVHPTLKYPRKTLLNGVSYYLSQKGEITMPRLVSRLDRDTTGVIVIAKNSFSHMKLAREMEKRTYKKEYIAIVHGKIDKKSLTIDKPILLIENEIKRVINAEGKRSITTYELICNNEVSSMVKLNLITGRTHQIRLHMSSIEHPLFGDPLYGIEEPEMIDRQALHAYSVEFPHPLEKRIIKILCPLPEDMNNLIKKLSLDKKVP